jgi:FkbM family methyltransferase
MTTLKYSRGYNAPSALYVSKNFTDFIKDKENIKNIIEAGSRDLIDALELEKIYPNATIYSFECNPECVELCKHNLQFSKNIIFTDKALSEINGFVEFYSLDSEAYTQLDPGVSSLYHYNDNYNIPMIKINVESIRGDTFLKEKNVNSVDMLCLDLQGGELNLLKSLGEYIKTVKYIILEFDGYAYNSAPQEKEILSFLSDNNFQHVYTEWSDKLFIKRDDLI